MALAVVQGIALGIRFLPLVRHHVHLGRALMLHPINKLDMHTALVVTQLHVQNGLDGLCRLRYKQFRFVVHKAGAWKHDNKYQQIANTQFTFK